MGMSGQLKPGAMPSSGTGALPTRGTITTPNGRVFNTNPAANQMFADRARMAKEQRMQPSPQSGGDMGAYSPQGGYLNPMNQAQNNGYNPPPPPNMSQYDAMQNQYAKDRSNFLAQNPALAPQQSVDQRQTLMAQQGMQPSPQGMGQPVQGGQQLVQGGNMGAAIPQEFFNKWQQQSRSQPSGQSVPNPTTNQATIDAMRQEVARSKAAGGVGQKGGQPPSPQQLGQGLQQQAMMQDQFSRR